jgi:hypothetical protein
VNEGVRRPHGSGSSHRRCNTPHETAFVASCDPKTMGASCVSPRSSGGGYRAGTRSVRNVRPAFLPCWPCRLLRATGMPTLTKAVRHRAAGCSSNLDVPWSRAVTTAEHRRHEAAGPIRRARDVDASVAFPSSVDASPFRRSRHVRSSKARADLLDDRALHSLDHSPPRKDRRLGSEARRVETVPVLLGRRRTCGSSSAASDGRGECCGSLH